MKIKERQRQQRQLAVAASPNAASVRAVSADSECVVSVGRRFSGGSHQTRCFPNWLRLPGFRHQFVNIPKLVTLRVSLHS